MTARVDRLGAGDLMTLWAEAPATPMHIALAGLLEPGPLLDAQGRPRLDELRAAIEARLARAPELRRRIRRTGFGQGRPVVVDDHRFAVARHVTAVDLEGCDEEGFWTWCANHALEPMDRDHPLWRVTFASGLASGRVGVLVVMHHALADGIAGAALAARLLDPVPDARVASRPWRPVPPPGPLALCADATIRWVTAVAAGLRRLPRAPAAVRAAARDAAATRAAVAQLAPATSLRRPIGPTRRLAVVRRPLREVKEAGHAHGATVNDVLLAAVAFGLHRLLARRGDPVDGLELRVSVPVGAPGGARNAGGSTPMVLPLPVGDLGDLDRLARIAATTRAAKEGRDRGYRGLLASPLVPTGLLRLAVGWLARHGGSRVNLYVTNVPGPPQPLWLHGARLHTAVPIAPLVAGVPLAVAALSYAGELAVSIQVDGAVDDLAVLASGISEGLDRLGHTEHQQPAISQDAATRAGVSPGRGR
jgi:diacylglycerol O-acyltransferase / wax synthase